MKNLYRDFTKPLLDKILALFLITILFPFYVGTTVIVLIFIGRPIFFTQKRPGKDEKIFTIYKYRTMTNEKDANGDLLPDEKRLRGAGKLIRSLSLDELPQLFNVLKGEMSFIGPRPLLVEYLDLYNEKQKRRHEVTPGITGLAQVNGRNNQTWEDRFNYDVEYVDTQSFSLDVKIFFQTIERVLKRDGVSAQGSATMERFKG